MDMKRNILRRSQEKRLGWFGHICRIWTRRESLSRFRGHKKGEGIRNIGGKNRIGKVP